MTYTRPTWIVDADAKTVLHESGALYRIERKDGQWTARTDNPEPFRSIAERTGGEEQIAAALDQWLGEIGLGRDLLVEAGKALHGERWIMPLARDLGVGVNTPRHWADGTTPLTVTMPIMTKLTEVLLDRAVTAERVHRKIAREIAARPAPRLISKRRTTGVKPAVEAEPDRDDALPAPDAPALAP